MSCTLAQEKIAQAKAAGHTELDLAGLELAELQNCRRSCGSWSSWKCLTSATIN